MFCEFVDVANFEIFEDWEGRVEKVETERDLAFEIPLKVWSETETFLEEDDLIATCLLEKLWLKT
jgi:hypothetical protein